MRGKSSAPDVVASLGTTLTPALSQREGGWKHTLKKNG